MLALLLPADASVLARYVTLRDDSVLKDAIEHLVGTPEVVRADIPKRISGYAEMLVKVDAKIDGSSLNRRATFIAGSPVYGDALLLEHPLVIDAKD